MNKRKQLSMLFLSLAFTYNANSKIQIPSTITLQDGQEINKISFDIKDIIEFNSKTEFDQNINTFVKNIIKYGKEKFNAHRFIQQLINKTFPGKVIFSEQGIIKLIALTKAIGIDYYLDVNTEGQNFSAGKITNNKIKLLIKLRKLTKKIIQTNKKIAEYYKLSEEKDISVEDALRNANEKLSPLQEKRSQIIMQLRALDNEINIIQASISKHKINDNNRRKEFTQKAKNLEAIFIKAEKLHNQAKRNKALDKQNLRNEINKKQAGIIKRVFRKIFG